MSYEYKVGDIVKNKRGDDRTAPTIRDPAAVGEVWEKQVPQERAHSCLDHGHDVRSEMGDDPGVIMLSSLTEAVSVLKKQLEDALAENKMLRHALIHGASKEVIDELRKQDED